MVRIIPSRLKSSNGKNGGSSQSGSRASSPSRTPPAEPKGLVLKTTVIQGRNLAAKDKSGTSDPFLVITLGDAGQSTPSISKNLNPEWNVSFDLPITGIQSMLLEAVCWDKDRFKNDYMGEFEVAVEDIFANGKTVQEPHWYTLEARGRGKGKKKKGLNVSGEVQMQFALADASDPAATPQELLQRLSAFTAIGPDDDNDDEDDDEDDDDELAQMNSLDLEDEDKEDDVDGKEPDTSDETDDLSKPEKEEKRKRKLRMKRLRKKTKARAYEFTGGSDVVGIVFLEISKITDLPPERNMTRTSFDMDPFVVASLGRKTYRTHVVRHNLNPVFEEKMVFQVMRQEQNYSMSFAVVDRDKLSGNDFVGTANFSLSNVIAAAPEADPDTGLYSLPEPPDTSLALPAPKQSRFRLSMSRSSSATSLNKLSRPGLTSRASQSSMQSNSQLDLPTPPSVAAPDQNYLIPVANSNGVDTVEDSSQQQHDDPLLKPYNLPLLLKNKDRWEDKHNPQLLIKAKYLPYPALRQQFWRAMLKQYDSDENARVSKVELTAMLDTLGSTLKESTIDGFFSRFSSGMEMSDPMLTYDQAVMCLEDQLQQSTQQRSWGDRMKAHMDHGHLSIARHGGQKDTSDEATVPPMEGTAPEPLNKENGRNEVPAMLQDYLGTPGERGDLLEDDLTDERGEEHVVEIRECPLCHQPRLNKKSDADIVTHVATCASQDWRQVNNIVMAGFVTSSQAQRKWYSKVITKISYGGYKLGANSANILVQDRLTGQINEERMSVYVRIGIRLLYKGLKSREMEKKRIRKMLRNMSFKQGKKYDDPASAREIQGFINFHQLDMSEVLLPTEEFKSFNEFFYRKLKPGARPCSAPENPRIIVSPADCRSVVFNTLEDAQRIWVKGREFSVERLLGNAYPDDVKRYYNGALGIFRLAPQDYHRFHIPVDGTLGKPKVIEGEYYTVNPMAIRSALDVYGENVRVCVPIDSVAHGRVMVICVGAMMVGSTVITRKAGEKVARAEDLGYFKFGGSTILLLFEAGRMRFDEDLVDNSNGAVETLLRVGMSIGHSPEQPQYLQDMRKDEEKVTQEERQEAKRRIEGSLAPNTTYQGPSGVKPTENQEENATYQSHLFLIFTAPSKEASMTAYMSRAPLALANNLHIMGADGRRTSARLADKEDAPIANGVGQGYEPVKHSQKAAASGKAKANGAKAGAKKRPAYDEDDDGFAFTRTRSKKAKAEPAQPPIVEEPAQQQQAKRALLKSTDKPSEEQHRVTVVSTGVGEKTGRRRSPRNSGGSPNDADPLPLPVKKRRKARGSDEGRQGSQASEANAPQPGQSVDTSLDHTKPIEITFDSTTIALPFADTPIIRRNQEMRRGAASGSRRSSLGMRGRRASSLIDTGKSNALPHDEVESVEFYKHIESEGLSEPRRMRQLLTWCGTRALDDKPTFGTEDGNAVLAAREIQSQLLKDFSTKSDLSDWFGRNEGPPPPSPPKANPKNIANQAKIQELEQELARLQTERHAWDALLRAPTTSIDRNPDMSIIDASILPSGSQAILSNLTSSAEQPSLTDATTARLRELTSDLEFSIDSLAANVHTLRSYTDVAGHLADEALATCAKVLEERDREGIRRAHGGEDRAGGQGTTMRDVLRGLSRVID
ncbi:MAG: hypothetical protein Q9163_006049 [Psora crenata]